MKAVLYEKFGAKPALADVGDPSPEPDGCVIEVKATGLCRSDWHGWMGHDPDVTLPHVPGHEFAGVVVDTGADVKKWRPGDRVTQPFVCGCGRCKQCRSGNQQVCDAQFQPGFTHWGSFARYVAVRYADENLVRLPDAISDTTAASLGCRFATAFRAVAAQGQVTAGTRVAVHGCGGVGLSAVMIAGALGADVIAVDISSARLGMAREFGACHIIDAGDCGDVAAAVRDASDGGVDVSLDALGSPVTCRGSIESLCKRGRHVQVGLLVADDRATPIPMDRVVANELEVVGSHGMQAHAYPQMLAMILDGRLQPEKLLGRTIALEDASDALVAMAGYDDIGITIIDRLGTG